MPKKAKENMMHPALNQASYLNNRIQRKEKLNPFYTGRKFSLYFEVQKTEAEKEKSLIKQYQGRCILTRTENYTVTGEPRKA